MKQLIFAGLIFCLFLTGCNNSKSNFEMVLPSPDSRINLYFNLNEGEPYYLVYHEDEIIIGWSHLGFSFGAIDFTKDLNQYDNRGSRIQQGDEIVNLPGFLTGEEYNQKTICLTDETNPGLICRIDFRAYNNAIIFKYTISNPGKEISSFDEKTTLELQSGNQPWMIRIDSSRMNAAGMRTGDSVQFPVTFENGEKEGCVVTQYPVSRATISFLEKQKGDRPHFNFRSANDTFENQKQTQLIQTPWRVIQFNKYGE